MKRGEIFNRCIASLGFPDGVVMDAFRQQIYDYINDAVDELVNAHPNFWGHIRETTISVVDVTDIYEIYEFCRYPLQLWTEANEPLPVEWFHPEWLDRNGLRGDAALNTGLNPNIVEWYEPTQSAGKSGTDCSINEDATNFVKVGDDSFVATDVGKMIEIDGEEYVYEASAFVSSNAMTLKKAYRSRRSGDGSDNTGTNVANKSWKMSPEGRQRIRFVPMPNESATVYCRYLRQHEKLIADEDSPDYIDPDLHKHIWHYAMWHGLLSQGKDAAAAAWEGRWREGMKRFNQSNSRKQKPLRRRSTYRSSLPYGRHSYSPYSNGKTWRM